MNDKMPWFKWWRGTVADMKLRMVAEGAGQSVATVVGLWAYLLEHASKIEDRGSIDDVDKGLMAYTMMVTIETVETVCNGMKQAGIVTETGEIAKWGERQAKRVNQEPSGASTKRVQAMRERKKSNKNNGLDGNGNGNGCNDNVTQGNGAERTKKKIENKSKPKPSSSSGDDGFAEFWDAYPIKVGKIDARKAWTKLKATPELLATILAAIEAQKNGMAWRRDDGEYIPHPATWLNGGRWKDQVRPYVERVNGDWMRSREAMVAKAASLKPPLRPNAGEMPQDFLARIVAALDAQGTPERRAAPTPYEPPMPAGGEEELSPGQRKARLAEMQNILKQQKQQQSPAADE